MTIRIVLSIALLFAIVVGAGAQSVPTTAIGGSAGAVVFDAAGTGSSVLVSAGIEYRMTDNIRFFADAGYMETIQQSIYVSSSDMKTIQVPYFLIDAGAAFSPFEGRLFPFVSAGVGLVIDARSSAAKEYPSAAVALSGMAGVGLAYDITGRIGTGFEARLRYSDPNAFALATLEVLGGFAFLF